MINNTKGSVDDFKKKINAQMEQRIQNEQIELNKEKTHKQKNKCTFFRTFFDVFFGCFFLIFFLFKSSQ